VDSLGHALSVSEIAQEPRLPGVRHPPDGDRAHRLRGKFCGIQPPAAPDAKQINGIEQIDVTAFKQQRDAGKDFFLLDVREPHEFKIAQIGGT